MIPGQLANVRAVLDYLSKVEPIPVRNSPVPPADRAVEVDEGGNFWAYPSVIDSNVCWPVAYPHRVRFELIGRVLRALGWSAMGRVPGIDPLRRAYYLKPFRHGAPA